MFPHVGFERWWVAAHVTTQRAPVTQNKNDHPSPPTVKFCTPALPKCLILTCTAPAAAWLGVPVDVFSCGSSGYSY